MPAEAIDSNVALYLIGSDPAKALQAELILQRRPIVSVQLLNEVMNVGRRKARLDWQELDELIGAITERADVRGIGLSTHRLGFRLAERYRLATYDAVIVAAALEADCATLWSEDMQHGLRVDDRLVILNPFLPQGATA